jgi:hypothetical protein
MRNILFRVNYEFFHVFVRSNYDLLRQDLDLLLDEKGDPLSIGYRSVEAVVEDCDVLQVGTDQVQM